jgi:uncharacterized integral membrane protein
MADPLQRPMTGMTSTSPIQPEGGMSASSEGVQESVPSSDETHIAPTRVSASWTAVVAAAFVLLLLVIFIAQNTQQSTVKFLWAHGKAPTSVVLLIAAIAGALVVIIVGVARIVQLRRTAKRAAQGNP